MKKTLLCTVAGLIVWAISAGSAYAQAEPWETSFTSSAVESYVQGEELRIVVVPSGAVDASDAADTLRGALEAAPTVSLVMDSSSLGDVSTLDDQAIVTKTANLPIDLVAVVRVFGKSPERTSVVTFYANDGVAHSAFTATEGKPLEPKESAPGLDGGQGVSKAASNAVASSVGAAGDDRSKAIDEFAEKFVWFQDWVTVSGETGAYMGSYSVPYRGKYREPLEGADFYEAVNRPDLAEEFRSNRRIKTALGTPAGLLVLGGLTFTTWGFVRGIIQTSSSEYNDETGEFEDTGTCFGCGNWQFWGGLTGLGVGTILAIINGTIDLYPTDASGSRRLADEFNRALADELGLTDMGDRENLPIEGSEPQRWKFDLSISPGGVSAVVEF